MNFLKRAMRAVVRRKGKSFIMFVIFAAIANLVLAGFAIQHATETASVLARQKLGGKLTLSFNRQAAMEKARAEAVGEDGPVKFRIQAEPITEAMANKVAGLENILDYNYTVNANGSADGFEPVVTEEDEQEDSSDNADGSIGFIDARGAKGMFGGDFVVPDVSVTGVSSTELLDAFNNEQAKLIEGRHVVTEDADKKVAIIEKNLAEENSLELGSKIKIKAPNADETIEYTIIGIYEAASSDTESEGFRMKSMPFTEPYNRIYTDYKSAIPLKTVDGNEETVTGGIDSAVFYVNDPKNIEKVAQEASKLDIDWDKYTLDTNETAYKQMMGPIENVASFSMTVIYMVAIAGAVILALILMLSIKERMYETGVLLSLGEGKIKIISQYVAEVLLIAIIAFGVSAFSGKYIAQEVGATLLDREIKTAQEQLNESFAPGKGGGQFGKLLGQRFEMGANGDIKPIDSISIAITTSEVGQMTGVGLIIIILGTILPASTVMRYKPKTILTKAT